MCSGSQQAANKEVVRRLYEGLFTQGHLELADELMTADYVNHDPPAGAGHTREDVKTIAADLRGRLANFAATIDRIIAEDDLVAVQGTISGVSSAGESTEIKLAEFFRMKDGRIAERWG